MAVLFDGWRIDPADVAVGAAVNQIDATVSGVTEHENRRARHVKFQRRFADRKTFQGWRRLGNDSRIVLRGLLIGRSTGNQRGRPVDGTAIEHFPIGARGMAILAPTLVTAQPLFDAQGRLIGAGIGIRRERVSFEHNARVEMHHALGSETESLPAYGDVPGKTTVEVFGHGVREARIDAPAQRLADLDVLARDAKWHDRPQMIDDPGRMHERLAPRMQIWTLPATSVRRRSCPNTIS